MDAGIGSFLLAAFDGSSLETPVRRSMMVLGADVRS